MGIICNKGSHALQFFHKSGQEFCAGKYLQQNLAELSAYLQEVKTVKDALAVAPVLSFASKSERAAQFIIQTLLDNFM